MSKISMESIQLLRERTGLGLMDCKKALEEANGDIEKAIELLRKKGALVAAKRSDKETTQGVVHAYIHPGAKLGVLLEVNCETDFVASSEATKKFVSEVCMHIAAAKPLYLNPEQVDPSFLEKEKEVFRAQMANSGKPEKVIEQILEGKISKLYSEICLMQQPFIKDDKKSIDDILKELIAKTGENIRIKRFARFEIGQ